MSVEMKFYNEVTPKLKNYISHYWTTTGVLDIEKTYKIFPMDHIDLIIPITGEYYHVYGDGERMDKTHIFFHGMRDESVEVLRHGFVQCFGITFKPWGFYPFIQKELSAFRNQSVDLSIENEPLAMALMKIYGSLKVISDEKEIAYAISETEAVLSDILEKAKGFEEQLELLRALCNSTDENIENIVSEHHLTSRTLERMFNKYIGINPRTFYKIRRFEEASRAVLYNESSNLTDIAYDSNYYDQSHFSRVFKKYAKATPNKIRQDKMAFKSHLVFK